MKVQTKGSTSDIVFGLELDGNLKKLWIKNRNIRALMKFTISYKEATSVHTLTPSQGQQF